MVWCWYALCKCNRENTVLFHRKIENCRHENNTHWKYTQNDANCFIRIILNSFMWPHKMLRWSFPNEKCKNELNQWQWIHNAWNYSDDSGGGDGGGHTQLMLSMFLERVNKKIKNNFPITFHLKCALKFHWNFITINYE